MIRTIFFVAVVGGLASCEFKSKREQALELQTDSLRQELQVSQQMTETLMEVGTLIDSIDASRHQLRTDMVEGISYNDYASRLRDIQLYVKNSYDKISEFENTIRKSKSAQSGYLAQIKQLKNDLEQRGKEMEELNVQLAKYKEENTSLVNTVALQGAELSDKMEQLAARQNEVTQLQDEVKKIIEQSKFDLADAYYAQAQALELAANRTKLAPRKKKNTQREALELYKLAAVTGKAEAQKKVEELEGKI